MNFMASQRPQSHAEQAQTLGSLLLEPYRILQKQIYEGLSADGFPEIRPAHSSVFRNISPHGSRVSEMAERAQMTKQSMGYLVDYLHEHGYVAFMPDPIDGRAKLACLTVRGKSVARALVASSYKMETAMTKKMGAAKIKELRSLLKEISVNLAEWSEQTSDA
jgi:DNA-binding MarR family transcriptional regulator